MCFSLSPGTRHRGSGSPWRRLLPALSGASGSALYPCPSGESCRDGAGSHHLVSATPNCHGTLAWPALAALFQQPASTAHAFSTTRFPGRASTFWSSTPPRKWPNAFTCRVGGRIRSLSAATSPSTPTSTNFSAERPHPATGRRPNRDAIRDRACELRPPGADPGSHPRSGNCIRQKADRVSESYLFFALVADDAGVAPKGQRCPSPTATGRARPRWFAGARRGRRATTGPDHRSAVQRPPRSRACFCSSHSTARSGSSRRGASGMGLPGSEAIPPLHAFLALLLP